MGSVLSVVVPIYNVERYLADCLSSLATQTYPDLDIILVDDGSTDGSGPVAEEWVARDGRFRLVRQINRGLGAARNAGIQRGTGDYLTFVDSDDVVPPYAFEVLVGALEGTGSHFASGNVGLLTSRGVRQSPLHRGTHRRSPLGITLRDQRNLVYDRLVCNKVFRREFWDRHGLRFPEGVRYEDIPVTIPAYALAGAVDVIELPVYYWRQREAGAELSISQRQTEVRNLIDRFAAVDSASRSLAGIGDGAMKDWYDKAALESDLRMFLHLLPDVGDAYRERFLDLAGDYLARVDPRVVHRLPPHLRVAWRLAERRLLPELLAVVSTTRDGTVLPVVRRGRGYYQDIPFLDAGHPELPRTLYHVGDPMRAQVHEVCWQHGRLRLRGHAYDPATGAARPWSAVRALWLRDEQRLGRRFLLPSLPRRSPNAPAMPTCHEWSGFQVSIDPRMLRHRGEWFDGSWTVFAVAVGRTGLQRRRVGGGEVPPPMPAAWVAPDVRVVPLLRKGSLRLVVERPRARATSCGLDGEDLVVTGELSDAGPPSASVRLCRVLGVPWRSYPAVLVRDGARTTFVARIPVTDLVGARTEHRAQPVGAVGDEWLVEFTAGNADGDDGVLPLPVSADYVDLRCPLAGRTVLAEPGDAGALWIRSVPTGPLVTEVREKRNALVFAGTLPARAGAGFELVLRFRDETPTRRPPADRVLPVELTETGWQAVLRPEPDGADPLAAGHWWLLQRPATDPGRDPETEPRDLPFTLSATGWVSARWAGGRLRLESDRHRRVVLRVAP